MADNWDWSKYHDVFHETYGYTLGANMIPATNAVVAVVRKDVEKTAYERGREDAARDIEARIAEIIKDGWYNNRGTQTVLTGMRAAARIAREGLNNGTD